MFELFHTFILSYIIPCGFLSTCDAKLNSQDVYIVYIVNIATHPPIFLCLFSINPMNLSRLHVFLADILTVF